MLYWALVFLLVPIVAGALGFGGVAVAFAAKIIFFHLARIARGLVDSARSRVANQTALLMSRPALAWSSS